MKKIAKYRIKFYFLMFPVQKHDRVVVRVIMSVVSVVRVASVVSV